MQGDAHVLASLLPRANRPRCNGGLLQAPRSRPNACFWTWAPIACGSNSPNLLLLFMPRCFPVAFHRLAVFLAVALCAPAIATASPYDVREFGAMGDGKTVNTSAIQAAIDAAHAAGGGTVLVAAGRYVTGTIRLRSHVVLRVDAGATLLGSTRIEDYPGNLGGFVDAVDQAYGSPLIYAGDAEHVGIVGHGRIDGRGFREHFPPNQTGRPRPALIRFQRTRHAVIEDVYLTNSAAWVTHLVHCEDVRIDGVTIRSYANDNNDAIDIDGSQRVLITNANLDTYDDTIVLKNLSGALCRDINISNSIVSGSKSAFKIGTESVGDFENITLSNLTIYGTRGLNLYSVDGARIRNVSISNVTLRDPYAVILLRLGGRMRTYAHAGTGDGPETPGQLEHVRITNVQATGVTGTHEFISGIPGHPIEGITLDNVTIEYAEQDGAPAAVRASEVPENVGAYPIQGMFGPLPSYSFFVRHARDVRLRNVTLIPPSSDPRPALSAWGVEGLTLESVSDGAREVGPSDVLRDEADPTRDD